MESLRQLRIRAICALFILVLAAGFSSPAGALTDEERAGARAAARSGEKAFNEKRWADAVDLYSRAEAIIHSPVHLLFIARARAELGQLIQARETYLKIGREQLAAEAPAAFAQAQESARTELEALDPRIPYLTVQIEGAGAEPITVTDTGSEMPSALVGVPRPVNPGTHTLQATGQTLVSEPQTLELAEGERKTVALAMQPARPAQAEGAAGPAPGEDAPPPPATEDTGGGANGLRIGSYVGFGVGAVGIALGAVFTAKAGGKRGDADDLFDSCRPGCMAEEQAEIRALDSDANSAKTIGITGFAIGGAGVATGVVLLILSNQNDSEQASSERFVRPYAGLDRIGVYGTF